jgi:PA domain
LEMRGIVTIKVRAIRCRYLAVALLVAGVAIPLSGVPAYAQDSYVDPSLGVGDSIIRSDVFVGDKQGRVPATEGLFTRQMSGWLSGNAEVLQGEVVHVSDQSGAHVGCGTGPYLVSVFGKIALIERGSCTFFEKITRAASNGAIGAIVYNSVAGGDALIRMGAPNPPCPTSLCPGLVPIPGFFVARSAGQTLAATPVNVKIQAASFKALKDGVTALQRDGTLTTQQAGSLKDTIAAASDAANASDFATAQSLISDFRAEILALANAGVLCCPPPPPPALPPASDWLGLNDAAGVILTRLQPPFTDDSQ